MQSFAKVNIGLQIRNKRQDGFHNIHTVFQELDLHEIIVLKLKDSECQFTSNVDWLNNDLSNLCVSAWRRLKDLFNIGGISINLTKKIPPGSGLGGGSSNAATILKGLARLYNLDIPFLAYLK